MGIKTSSTGQILTPQRSAFSAGSAGSSARRGFTLKTRNLETEILPVTDGHQLSPPPPPIHTFS
ncbi:MAG: hypothetical protein LBD22_03570 [Spirochaetaceae bacterium]|nr:hypothetical protein [Spirochaetaceae bacterium]